VKNKKKEKAVELEIKIDNITYIALSFWNLSIINQFNLKNYNKK